MSCAKSELGDMRGCSLAALLDSPQVLRQLLRRDAGVYRFRPISPEGPLGQPPLAFVWLELTSVLTIHALDAIECTFSP